MPSLRRALRTRAHRSTKVVTALSLAAVVLLLGWIFLAVPAKSNCRGAARCFSGPVTRIIDGDTIDVGDERIRLALVNSPESGQPGYAEATTFTGSLCPIGSNAFVDEDDGQTGGSYGRIVAKVTCGPHNLNGELLASGHAVLVPQYCAVSEFEDELWTGC